MIPRVLLVDDDTVFIDDLLCCLGERFEWITHSSHEGILKKMEETGPDVLLLDIELGGGVSGLDVLAEIRRDGPRTPVIMVTRHEPEKMAAEAWRRGAFGYVGKGIPLEQMAAQIERAIEEAAVYRVNEALREEVAERAGQLVGESSSMKILKREIARVAQATSTVLITGETGTGKELVARAIHDQSPRRRKPFVAVRCPAIAENLVESELFGHEKGAFTGAVGMRRGKFELARQGTIFLDEISEISPALQTKLLAVLQERCVSRVGGSREIEVDVRVLAATNRNLDVLVAQGSFREDLLYRLRVVPICIPPLRERKEDIPLLAQAILDRKCRDMHRGKCQLASEALDRLVAWDWPGNVRELENVLENALVHATSSTLGEGLLVGLVGAGIARLTYTEARERMLERFETDYVRLMLRESAWNVSETARRMGLTRQGLQKLMKRRGVAREA